MLAAGGHVNILNVIESGQSVYSKGRKQGGKDMFYIATPICLGELFDFIDLTGRFNDDLARYYFS